MKQAPSSWLLMSALLALAACAGPERVPHQPIPGVDTEHTEVRTPPPAENKTEDPPENKGEDQGAAAPAPIATAAPAAPTTPAPPAPPGGGSGEGAFLAGFVQQLAAAHRAAPGVVAVFPALSRSVPSVEPGVTALGELLMTATADGLEAALVGGVLAGDALVNDLRAANRGLDAWRGADDVYWLGDRLGAAYVVFGTEDLSTLDALSKDVSLDIRWQAVRTADRTTVGAWREVLRSGALAQRLARLHHAPSHWRVGAQAPRFEPSLQLEARLLGRQLAARLAAEHAGLLQGKRVRVEPTVVAGRSGARAALQGWAVELERKLDAAVAKAGGDGDLAAAEQAALQSGPVTVGGHDNATFADALDAFRAQRAALEAGGLGDLEHDVAAALAEHLREALHGEVQLLAGDAEREAMLAVLRREARAARADDSVDAATVAALKAGGVQTCLTTTLRRDLEAYVLRATLLELDRGTKVTVSATFEPQFRDALDAALNR